MQTINGRDPGVVRFSRDIDGEILLKIEEERSQDTERHHANEDVSWFTINEGMYEFL
jgi:hypothetical protein